IAHQHHHQQQQLSSTLNNHKRTASSTSNSSYSELLDLSSHSNNNNKNNNNNGVINLAKKIKRESTPPSLLLSMPCSVLTNSNYQQRPLVTADDLPSLIAQTPTSILISSANNNNKCKLTTHDNTFTALYSAAHLKSSRQSKLNVCTPIEHYGHVLLTVVPNRPIGLSAFHRHRLRFLGLETDSVESIFTDGSLI
ncbi:unnamed protein product, partial [Rotaria sp. Silwood1]